MKTAYVNGKVLSGKPDMAPEEGLVILVENETITAVLPQAEADLQDCEIYDLAGRYIMPGLINMHVHIPASGKPTKKPTDPKKTVKLVTANGLTRKVIEMLYKSYVKTELFSGVTTMRTMGGVENYDGWVRDLIYAGKADGPRILAGNMAVSVPGGHMAGSLAYEATTPEEAAFFVEKIAADKPDIIKLMITGGVLDAVEKGEPGVLKMKPELVKAACDRAHALGYKVAAHVESPEGVRVALSNGVDTIEHGAKPDDEILRLFKERDAAVIVTLSPALPYALFDLSVSNCGEMAQFNGKVVFDGIIECGRKCLENGIPVGMGTDTGCPFITHYDMWREVNYFAKYMNVSNAAALSAATLGNAKIAGIDSVTGSIEAGKAADMIICDRNPLEDLTVLRNLHAVVTRGKRYDKIKIKKMPQVEAELDKFI